jgi:bifunctional non-homologous end joining protein LigD
LLKTTAFGEGEFPVVGLAQDPKGPPIALLAREGPEVDLRYAGGAFLTLPHEERDELRRAAEFLEVKRPAVRHTGKQRAQWLWPGLIARVRFLRGDEKLRHATVMSVRAHQLNGYC